MVFLGLVRGMESREGMQKYLGASMDSGNVRCQDHGGIHVLSWRVSLPCIVARAPFLSLSLTHHHFVSRNLNSSK